MMNDAERINELQRLLKELGEHFNHEIKTDIEKEMENLILRKQ